MLALLRDREQVTLINTVPSAMAELVRGEWVPESVETVNLAGEALSRELVEQVYGSSRVQRLWNLYGPTEDTTYSTAALITESEKQEKPLIGRPIANTQAYVLDEEMQVVPVGVAGELYLGGEGLARGYLNRPELTAERFVLHPLSTEPGARLYRTGDLVRYRSGGELEYLGRIDQQVKVEAIASSWERSKRCCASTESVREAVVVAEKRRQGSGSWPMSLQRGRQEMSVGEFKSELTGAVAGLHGAECIVVMAEMPLTPNGKVDRKALPAPELSRD